MRGKDGGLWIKRGEFTHGWGKMLKQKACPVCKGDLEFDSEDNEWVCIQGGHRFGGETRVYLTFTPIPLKPQGIGDRRPGTHELHAYYKANIGRIKAEVREFGESKTRERWGIPPSSWVNFKNRWEITGKQSNTTSKEPDLPPFPPFNESWGDGVKAAWLESYARMADRGEA